MSADVSLKLLHIKRSSYRLPFWHDVLILRVIFAVLSVNQSTFYGATIIITTPSIGNQPMPVNIIDILTSAAVKNVVVVDCRTKICTGFYSGQFDWIAAWLNPSRKYIKIYDITKWPNFFRRQLILKNSNQSTGIFNFKKLAGDIRTFQYDRPNWYSLCLSIGLIINQQSS